MRRPRSRRICGSEQEMLTTQPQKKHMISWVPVVPNSGGGQLGSPRPFCNLSGDTQHIPGVYKTEGQDRG